MRNNSFTIGQLAKAARLPTTTLRYYERTGLLKPEARTGGNYRSYSNSSLDRLLFIRRAQSAGLGLDDIATLLDTSNHRSPPCAAVQKMMKRRLDEIDQRLKEMQTVRAALVSALRSCRCGERAGICGEIEKLSRK